MKFLYNIYIVWRRRRAIKKITKGITRLTNKFNEAAYAFIQLGKVINTMK